MRHNLRSLRRSPTLMFGGLGWTDKKPPGKKPIGFYQPICIIFAWVLVFHLRPGIGGEFGTAMKNIFSI